MTIDVQPFIDKLEVLKEYMVHKIDGEMDLCKINFVAIPVMPVSEVIRIFNETGVLVTRTYDNQSVITIKSFEEFYQQKIKTNQCT